MEGVIIIDKSFPSNKDIGILQSNIDKKININSEISNCIICGEPIISKSKSFHKSHTIPFFCLENIKAKFEGNHKVLTPSGIRFHDLLDRVAIGTNKAGIFYLICPKCDSNKFQVYESQQALLDGCTKNMMDSIALKAYLKEYYDATYNSFKAHLDYSNITESEILQKYMTGIARIKKNVTTLDRHEFGNNLKVALNSFKNYYGNYKLIYYETLDYTVPLAAQTVIPISRDIKYNEIQDVTERNPKPIEELIVCVFPMKEKSVIILFTQIGNRKLKKYIRQFKQLSPEDKLKECFYLLIRYKDGNYFLSPLIYDLLKSNKSVQGIMSIEDGAMILDRNYFNMAWFEDHRWKTNMPNILLSDYSMQTLSSK